MDLINKIIYEERVPIGWKVGEIVPIFKQKGDFMECGSYRGVKLLEHALKLLERLLEKRLRELVQVDSMQCGFMKGKSSINAIFMVRQIQEKYLEKKCLEMPLPDFY